jgi:hypothetical protein
LPGKVGVDVGSNRETAFASARHAEAIVARRARDAVLRRVVQSAVDIGPGSTIGESKDPGNGLMGVLQGIVDATLAPGMG